MTRTSRLPDWVLAYPEPPAHPLWHEHAHTPTPLTPEEQQVNFARLERALPKARPRTRRASNPQPLTAEQRQENFARLERALPTGRPRRSIENRKEAPR